MPDYRRWIDRCCRTLNRGLVLRVLADWLAVWLCVFGAIVLVVKTVWPMFWPEVMWLAVTLLPLWLLAIGTARRRRFMAGDGAALLDARLKTRGLLMTIAEEPAAPWHHTLPESEARWRNALPRLRPVRFLRVVCLPAAFAVVAACLPAREVERDAGSSTRRRPLKAVAELPELLSELEQARALEPGEYEFLREEVDELVEETSDSPLTAEQWRRIDTLRARLHHRLEAELRTLSKGQQAAQQLAQADATLPPPQREQFEKDVSTALRRLTKRPSPSADSSLPKPAEQTRRATDKTSKTRNKTSNNTRSANKTRNNTRSANKTSKTESKTDNTKTDTKKADTKSVAKAGTTPKTQSRDKRERPKPTGNKPTDEQPTTPKQKVTSHKPAEGDSGSRSKTDPSPTTGTAGKTKTAKGKQNTGTKNAQNPGQKPQAGNRQQAVGKTKGDSPTNHRGKRPDISKLRKLAKQLSPELRQQLLEMARSGRVQLPRDPELRRKLMQQVGKLLDSEKEKLAEIRRRFSRWDDNADRRRLGSIPSDTPLPQNDRHGSQSPQQHAGGSPTDSNAKAAGSKSTTATSSGSSPQVSFRDVVLPPGLIDANRRQRQGVTGRRPKVAEVKPSAHSGNGDVAPAENSDWTSWNRNLPPRYRTLLRDYFARQQPSSEREP